jgi:hypothetical protein
MSFRSTNHSIDHCIAWSRWAGKSSTMAVEYGPGAAYADARAPRGGGRRRGPGPRRHSAAAPAQDE